jgi:hypothetical protein
MPCLHHVAYCARVYHLRCLGNMGRIRIVAMFCFLPGILIPAILPTLDNAFVPPACHANLTVPCSRSSVHVCTFMRIVLSLLWGCLLVCNKRGMVTLTCTLQHGCTYPTRDEQNDVIFSKFCAEAWHGALDLTHGRCGRHDTAQAGCPSCAFSHRLVCRLHIGPPRRTTGLKFRHRKTHARIRKIQSKQDCAQLAMRVDV